MKKNLFWSMLTVLMVAMLSVSFTACGGNDDDDDDGPDNSVTGTWVGQGYGEDDDEKVTIVFRGNLTGTFTVSYYDPHDGNEKMTSPFTYTLNEDNTGVMLVKYDDDDDSGSGYDKFYFWLEGDKLYIDERLHGTPEWVLTKK